MKKTSISIMNFPSVAACEPLRGLQGLPGDRGLGAAGGAARARSWGMPESSIGSDSVGEVEGPERGPGQLRAAWPGRGQWGQAEGVPAGDVPIDPAGGVE